MTTLETTFLLFIIYQVKHYVADFPLQNSYMLKKVLGGWDFVLPLAAHCAVHAVLTAIICLYFRPELLWLAGFDFLTHFAMDRLKAGDKYLGRYRDKQKASYWNSLGLDQMVHHITHLYIIWCLVQ